MFEKILFEKLNKEGLTLKNNFNEIYNVVNNGLDYYIKNILEKLINVSRARNVNLSLYSKFSEKNPMFKIHTYNFEKVSTSVVDQIPYRDFSIVFTTNMKNVINTLEHYEELNAYKSKIEKISTFKNKIDELNVAAATEKKEKDVVAAKTTKPRSRRKNAVFMKNYKRAVANTQKKNEMDRQKKDTQYTLQTFLDNKPVVKTRVYHINIG